MCGIFGYALSGAPPEGRPSLRRAIQNLKHRGPDGEGTFLDDKADPVCGLAHARLAIIDLSPNARQPMSSGDGRFTLVFNGEIYNYRKIREELVSRGSRFRSTSDTEVLLEGYAMWGGDVLSRLRGMFAFAIWDARERSLFMARDPLGVKPLYVARTPRGVLFASELRTLLRTGLVATAIDREGLASYLAFGSVREPNTIVDGVTMLGAGTFSEFKNGQLSATTYWTPPIQVDSTTSRDAVVAELAGLLRESVSLRLESDVPVGIFLSGGLDSTSIVALASAAARTPVHTFTVTFDEAAYDEARFAREVAERFGTVHHPIRLSGAEVRGDLDDALAALDQPSADGANTYFVSRAVRAAGISVVMSGIGGDELFGGYSGFRYFRKLGHAIPLLRHLSLPRIAELGSSFPMKLRKPIAMLATRGDPFAVYSLIRGLFMPAQRRRLLAVDTPERIPPTDLDARIGAWASRSGADFTVAYGLFDLTNYLRNTLLRDTDVMGMANSLEIREPLLDRHLVDRALTIPARLKLSRDRNKPLLADAVGDLPRGTATRPKMGFTLPFEAWLRGPLRDWTEQRLNGSELLRPAEVQRFWQAFGAGKLSYSRVWAMVALLDWTRRNGVALDVDR